MKGLPIGSTIGHEGGMKGVDLGCGAGLRRVGRGMVRVLVLVEMQYFYYIVAGLF